MNCHRFSLWIAIYGSEIDCIFLAALRKYDDFVEAVGLFGGKADSLKKSW